MDAADKLSDEDVHQEKLLAFVRRLAQFRPSGLEGQIEDDVAGIRHDAEDLVRDMSLPPPSGASPVPHRCAPPFKTVVAAKVGFVRSLPAGGEWTCPTCNERYQAGLARGGDVDGAGWMPVGKAKATAPATAPLTPGEKATIDAMRAAVEHALAQEMGPKLAAAAVGRTPAGQTCIEKCAFYPNCPHPSAPFPECSHGFVKATCPECGRGALASERGYAYTADELRSDGFSGSNTFRNAEDRIIEDARGAVEASIVGAASAAAATSGPPETPSRMADVARVEIKVDPRLPSASATIHSPKDYVSMADVLKDFAAGSDEAKIAERFFGLGAELVTIYKTPDGSPVVETREFCELGHHGLVDPACVSCARARPRRRTRPAGCVCPDDGSGTCEAHLPKDPLPFRVNPAVSIAPTMQTMKIAMSCGCDPSAIVHSCAAARQMMSADAPIAVVESLREVHRSERESWERHRDRLSEEVKILRAFAERCMAPENDGLPGIQEAAQDAISAADAARSAATPPAEDERVVPRREPTHTVTMRQPAPNPRVDEAVGKFRDAMATAPGGGMCGSVSPLGGDICCRRTHGAMSACVAKNGSMWSLAGASARSLPVAPPVSAPDPRGGPFPPSTRGTQTNVGISPRDLFAKAFEEGWSAALSVGDLSVALASALAEAGISADPSVSPAPAPAPRCTHGCPYCASVTPSPSPPPPWREMTADQLRAAQRRLFEKAYRAGWWDALTEDASLDIDLAASLKKERLA